MAQERSGLQAELDAFEAESAAARSDEVNRALLGTADWLRAEGAVDKALGIGDTAPNFSLPNAVGVDVELAQLLERGPVVAAFYRGGW